ncbi:protein CNGC15b-like [Rhodamnia argentea]|uniref:Protein CNGC15b-like n=1 Tax=Rhodamnia argentea TaxID=178133 RepID=A0A8B8NVL6_9MYRT|nr:protein CNGC15b-like [Rhodamnia argentea]
MTSVMGYSSARARFGRVGDESFLEEIPRIQEGEISNEDAACHDLGSKTTRLKIGKSLKVKVLRRVFSEDYDRVKSNIFDPRGQTIQWWNRIFFMACLVSLFVDPLFFLVPSIDSNRMCLEDASALKIFITIIRSVVDAFYTAQIFVRFKTAYVAPSSRVFGRGELVIDSKKIALRYLSRGFWIDLFAAIPLPQLLIWAIIPNLAGSMTAQRKNHILFIIFFQYLPRFYLILPLRSEIIDASGGITETAWAGAAYNLMLFMLASHVAGACWYLLAMERQEFCWRSVCDQEKPLCRYSFFHCRHVQDPGRDAWYNLTNLTNLCNPNNADTPIQWGVYSNFVTELVASCKFFSKYFFCFWWGLNNLSDIGQNLVPATYIGDELFVIVVATIGLVLLALLIGNMQRYVQSTSIRLEQWRIKRIGTEQWMHHRLLPPELRQSIQKYDQYKWVTTRGVDEEALLRDLPKDLRREINRHICFDLVRRVPLFNQMDERTLDAICERLKPILCTQDMFLVCQGDPIRDMFFIVRGHLNSWATNGGGTGINSCCLGPSDFCGEELLTWALDPRRSIVLPSSTRTVKAVKEVEAFSLAAEDLKFVAMQFRSLHSKKLRHKFRFYSHQWRTWAASFIQSAWRRHKKLKEETKSSEPMAGLAGSNGKLKPSRSFWDVYAKELIESTRRDENNQAGSASDAVNTVQKPVDLDFSVDY